jgi:multidrug efflux system outer membrane protein
MNKKPLSDMRKLLIYIPVLILAVNGCMVGPKLEKPKVETPDNYRFAESPQDSLEYLAWWEVFGDEYLERLIDSALENNRNLRIAASRILEAQAVVGYNRADIYPNFGYDGSASRQKPNPQFQGTAPGNLYSFGANVFWELDFWGKYRRATQAARAELLATEYGYRTVQISLISGVASLYFQLLDFQARMEISERTWDTRRESLRIIQERYDKGIIPELDLNQAQIQEAIAAGSVPLYASLVANTENALSVLVGSNPGPIEYGPASGLIESPEIPAGLPSQLLERRPDILAAEQQYYAQTARIGVAQAMRFPSISLTGSLGAVSTDLSSFSAGSNLAWSLGGGIVGPIFNFGKNKRRVEIERQRAEQSLLVYEETVLQAFREVEDALVDIENLQLELVAVNRRVTAAVNAASLSAARYDGGQTSYLEVLESERQMFNAELAAAQIYREHLESYVRLYKALGGGWVSEEERKMDQKEAGTDSAAQ